MLKNKSFGVVAAILLAAASVHASTGLVNLGNDDAPAVKDAAAKLGQPAERIRLDKPLPDDMRLIILDARTNLTDAQLKVLGQAVQRGASLFVGLSDHAGRDGFYASFMLPTMAWSFRLKEQGPLAASELDPDLFADLQGFSVPYAHQIRPFSAVERGQARYNQFEHGLLFSNNMKAPTPVPANSNQWTRPLINRDWRIRMRTQEALSLPLLITGQYGRGRVAVFASGFETLDQSPQGSAFAGDVIKWLLAGDKPAELQKESLPEPVTTVDAQHRVLQVEVSNPTGSPLKTIVIGRVMTWEPTLIGDVEKPLEIPAGGKATVELQLPVESDTGYAAASARDQYQVRLGVLSADGASLLTKEKVVNADLRNPLLMSLRTDDTRSYQWQYAGAPVLNPENRMGSRINEYAYKSGQTVHAELVLDNGARNLAAMATAVDETTPDNPTIKAINDGFAASERNPIDGIQYYGTWRGKQGVENVVSLKFPQPVLISSIVVVGAATDYRRQDRGNPAAISIEADGKQIASEATLSDRMLAEQGRVRIAFAPVTATVVKVRLPWVETAARNQPTLGDVEVWGTTEQAFPSPVQGTASISLHDLNSDAITPIGDQKVSVDSGGHQIISVDVPLPKTDGKPAFYQIQAKVGDQLAQAPVMVTDAPRPMPSIAGLKGNAVDQGFIVTRGFHNIFRIGSGTQEPPPGWAGNDDLIWAYEHNMKETGGHSNYQADKLYVTENDMRHYSTQWRHFPSGNAFYHVAAPLLIDEMSKLKDWATADTAVLGHSDRWDAGPPVELMFCWPEMIAFDQWMRSKMLGKLTGRTKAELSQEINDKYLSQWYAYHLEQYQDSVDTLKNAFAAVGKRLVITSQGCPLVPPAFSKAICDVIRGNSDDCTWGMEKDDVIQTTGKQMGALAFNPNLAMCTLLEWQFVNATLNNPQWHLPVGTTEPSRRMLFDRAFRGTLRFDGSYQSMHSYGYNSNVGDPFTLTDEDFADWKRVYDLHTLTLPDAPMGAGLVIGNAYLEDPANTRFSGSSPTGAAESHIISTAVGTLQRAGVSIPFSANALCLEHWQGDAPLIILNLQKFTDRELGVLKSTMARGVKVAAFCQATESLSPAAAELFGVDAKGEAADGKVVGTVAGHNVIAKGNALFVPLDGETMIQPDVDGLLPLLADHLALPLRFDAGSAGYGFISNGRKFIVVEDWREEGRVLHVRLKAGDEKEITAIGVNDGIRLASHKDGSDWVIDLPTRPGDANLICVMEH